MLRKLISLAVGGLLVLAALGWPAARPALAAPAAPAALLSTFTVNSFLDQVDDEVLDLNCHTVSGTCTLRAAVMQANVLSSLVSPVTIIVPAGTYTLALGSLSLTNGPGVIRLVGAGAASTIIDAHQTGRVLSVAAGRSASLSGLTLTGGLLTEVVDGDGSGINNSGTLTLDRSVVSGNQTTSSIGLGGGLNNQGSLTIIQSTITQNQAWSGGGLFNYPSASLTLVNSTVSGNSVTRDGGGLYAAHDSQLAVINSTVSQNQAARQGGGLVSAGAANLYNTTIVFNLADADQNGIGTGGGIFFDPLAGASVALRNSLVAGNGAGTLGAHDDCTGTLYAYGQNLFGTAGDPPPCTINEAVGGHWDYLNSLALLGPLQDNGGPTFTHALLAGSNAIEGGNLAPGCVGPDSNPLPTDQRGLTRIIGPICDIGAFEFSPLTATVPVVVNNPLDQVDDDTRDGVCHTASNTCTLRAAIMQAAVLPAAYSPVVISVPAGTYTLTLTPVGADDGSSGDLNVPSGLAVIHLAGAGAGSTIIDAHQIDRVLTVAAGGAASLSGVTLTGGLRVSAWGGGLFNAGTLTLDQVTVSNNHVTQDLAEGGGLYNQGRLTVANSTVSGNSSFEDGGGLFNASGTLTMTNSTLSGNNGSFGGGLTNAGSLTVAGSTLSGNTAFRGGGIHNRTGASLTLINSTLSQNHASADGGGLFNQGAAEVYNATIAFNVADSDQNGSGTGGGLFAAGSAVNLRNSLLAGNGVGTISTHDDCTGTLYAYGQNLLGTTGDLPPCTIISGDAGSWDTLNSLQFLGPLQDNGGPTLTHALLPGNDGVDWGDPALGCIGPDSQLLPTDQRGRPRVAGAYCDIGAYELMVLTPVAYLPFVGR